MTRVIIPDAFAAQVHNWTSSVELCDASGQVLGTFTPTPTEDVDSYHDAVSPFSEEEIRRRLAEPGGRSLAEIWKSLESR